MQYVDSVKKHLSDKVNIYLVSVQLLYHSLLKIDIKLVETLRYKIALNPLRPNSDLSQTSHCNIKGLSVSELMRIEKMITQVNFN